MSVYAEDADGYRAVWAEGGYSKDAYLKAKAHWQSMPTYVPPPPPPKPLQPQPLSQQVWEALQDQCANSGRDAKRLVLVGKEDVVTAVGKVKRSSVA